MYERLTERTDNGEAIPRMDIRANGHGRCLARLAEYEDLGYSPEELKTIIERQERQGRQKTDKCRIRPGMRILCKTSEEAHSLLTYLALYGYTWPDGAKLHWQDNFFCSWGSTSGTSYSVHDNMSNGSKYICFGVPKENDIPFATLGLTPAGGREGADG